MGALIDEIKNGTIMKKIKAIIEKANDGGISIYSEDVNGAYGFGLTEQEAKDDSCLYWKNRLNITKRNMVSFLCGISLAILFRIFMI